MTKKKTSEGDDTGTVELTTGTTARAPSDVGQVSDVLNQPPAAAPSVEETVERALAAQREELTASMGPTIEETVKRALAAQRDELEASHAKDIETERERTARAVSAALEQQREHELELAAA